MIFNKYCVPLLLLCALLVSKVNQTESGDVETDIMKGLIPVVSTVLGLTVTGPIAPLLMGSLGLLEMTTNILTGDNGAAETISKADMLEKHTEVMNSIKDMRSDIIEGTKNLMHTMKSHGFMEDMRNGLDQLSQGYTDNMKVILNDKIKGITKKTSMQAMIDYFSSFRQILRSFVSKFIKAKGVMATSGNINLFYDYLLEKERFMIEKDDDCYLESTQFKFFKSYMYILKILTDAYAMVITAHTVQYQNELKAGDESEANEMQKTSLKLLDQYKLDIKALMDKTKWALDNASRDIRNCGTFELKRGETYDTISFAHTLPKFRDWNYDRNAWYSRYSGPTYSCYTREQDVNFDDYEINGECIDGGLGRPASLEVFVNTTNSDWPYKYLKNSPSFSANKVLGNSKAESNDLVTRKFVITRSCYSTFCPAFKKNAVAISTQIVRAKPGNVITGLRFRIDSVKVIYIDIQEGKFIDDLTVDPDTVTWTESPKSNELLYMDSNIRNIELGDVELEDNKYLTSIQLDLKNKLRGIIGLIIGGSNAPKWETSTPKEGYTRLSKSNEIVLSECDNPDQFSADEKNIISKPPVQSEAYHVSFQASDLNKDLGSTTIPWFDVREVYSYPPIPLGGVGIIHETIKGSSGFILLKLKSPNLIRFIN